MKRLLFCALILICAASSVYADCESAVSKKIRNSGYLDESDRDRLLEDCEKFQSYRLTARDNPESAYVLSPGTFVCHERQDYVDAYNWVLDRGGTFNPETIASRFKSCRIIQNPTLVAIRTPKDPSSPVVEILYHNEYDVYYLHEGWVHSSEIIPYSSILERRIK